MASGARYKLNTAKGTEEAKWPVGLESEKWRQGQFTDRAIKKGAEAVIRA